MMNKKAQSGESLLMILRFSLLMLISFSIYFIGAIYLDYNLDILNTEAGILSEAISECIAPDNKINNLDEINQSKNILRDYCKINGKEELYIFINLTGWKDEVLMFKEISSINKEAGLIYDVQTNTKNIDEYGPGSFIYYSSITMADNTHANLKIGVRILSNE
jgi:hypothetical protein